MPVSVLNALCSLNMISTTGPGSHTVFIWERCINLPLVKIVANIEISVLTFIRPTPRIIILCSPVFSWYDHAFSSSEAADES